MSVWDPDPDFLYHGTNLRRLLSIRREGLTPGGAWPTSDFSRSCYVYLTNRVTEAAAYTIARFLRPVILRVHRRDVARLGALEPDHGMLGWSYCLAATVPPSAIEVCRIPTYAGELGEPLVRWKAAIPGYCAGRWRRLR